MSFMDNLCLQLYTVRDEAEKDFLGTLEKVSAIGYKGVEFAGFFNTPAEALKEKLNELSLIPIASHTSLDLLKNDLGNVIAYNKTIGTKYIVCPWAKAESAEEVNELVQLFIKIAPKIQEAGMELGYHNHEHEFKKIEGKHILDILFEKTANAGVFPQIDVFWVEFAGLNPVDYIGKYTGRTKVIHLKDMKQRGAREFAEVGSGLLDMKSIIQAGINAGAKYFTVEQDKTDRPSLESCTISYENLKKISEQFGF